MFVLAEARTLAVHAVFAVCAHPLSAVWATEARLAQTASVDVVAAGAVSAVTHAFTVLAVSAHSTLLITPEGAKQVSDTGELLSGHLQMITDYTRHDIDTPIIGTQAHTLLFHTLLQLHTCYQ